MRAALFLAAAIVFSAWAAAQAVKPLQDGYAAIFAPIVEALGGH